MKILETRIKKIWIKKYFYKEKYIMERHTNIPAAYLMLIKDNKILLSRRFNTWYGDWNYTPVAWHLEPQESFTQCIIREAKEEAWISIKPEDLKVSHILHLKTNELENNERIHTFFVANNWKWEIKNMEPNKCDDLSRFDLDNLPNNIVIETKQVIHKIRNNIFYSEQWR